MRTITIDLRGAEAICSSYNIGRDGENRAQEFEILLPDRLVGYKFWLEFAHERGWRHSSKAFAWQRRITYELTRNVVSHGTFTLSIVASKDDIIDKLFERDFVCQESISVNENAGVDIEMLVDHENRISALEQSNGMSAANAERYISDLTIRIPDGADSDSYLFEADYSANNFDYNFANKELEKRYVPSGACSAVRKGSLVGRNFDWFYNDTADVVVRASKINGRYASIGIAQVSGLTAEKLNSRNPDDIDDYKVLPFLTLDGVNENGVYCSINVTSGERGITTGTNPGAERLCGLAIVRFVIDYAESAANAVELLQDMDIWVPHSDSISYEYHFLISDRTESYIVEFVDNTMVYFKCEDSERNPAAIITNFPLVSVDKNNWFDGNYTSREEATEETEFFRSYEHPSGVERFDILKSEFDGITDENSLLETMRKVRFTEAYNRETNPFWYSEFSGDFGEYGNLAWGTPVEEYTEIINRAISKYESGERNSSSWQTTHTAIYNLNSLELSVFTQEDYDRECKFQLVEQSDFGETNTKSRNYIKNKPTKLSDFENDLEIKTAIEIVESGNTSKFYGREILSLFAEGNVLLYNGYPIISLKANGSYVRFSVIIDDVYTTYQIATYNRLIDYETFEKHFFEDKDAPISTGKNYLRNGGRYWVDVDTICEKASYVGKLELDPDAQGLRFIWSAEVNNSYTYMRIAYSTGAKIYARLQIGASSYMFLASTEQTVDTFYFDGVLTVAGQVQYCRLSIDSSDIILHTENVVNAIEDVQVNGVSIISNKIANINLSGKENKVYTGKMQITSQSPMTLAWISETENSYADMRAAYNNGSKVEIALMTGANQWTKLPCTTYDSTFFGFQLPLRFFSDYPLEHYFVVISSNGISVAEEQIAFADDIPDSASDLAYDNTESGLEAETVQGAIDEINNDIVNKQNKFTIGNTEPTNPSNGDMWVDTDDTTSSDIGIDDVVGLRTELNSKQDNLPSGTNIGDLLVWDGTDWVAKPKWQTIYQPVEYIESTGTQWIDTRYTPTNTTGIRYKASHFDFGTKEDLYFVGGIVSGGGTRFSIGYYHGKWDYGFNGYYITETQADTSAITEFKLNYKNNRNFVVNEQIDSEITDTIISSIASIGLMAAQYDQDGPPDRSIYPCRLYVAEITEGETVVRRFVPVRNIIDGSIGMYETVEGKFYGNSGTGVFLKGDDV